LLPGFIEPHCHILPTIATHTWIDLGPFEGQELRSNVPDESGKPQTYNRQWVFNRLRTFVKEQQDKKGGDNPWITGVNVDPSLFADGDKAFNAEVLDIEVTDEYPILILNASGHLAYANTKALKTAIEKIPEPTPEYLKSSDGVLKELAEMLPVISIIPGPSDEELNESAIEYMKLAASLGLTFLMDAATDPEASNADKPSESQVSQLKALAKSNFSKVRIGSALLAISLESYNKSIANNYQPGTGDHDYFIPFIKLVSDGSNQGLTGYQFTPYDCDENYLCYDGRNTETSDCRAEPESCPDITKQENTGIFNYGYPVEFDALVSKTTSYGWPLMIHANGDHAITRTISAIENASLDEQSRSLLRNRIEHCSLLSDGDIQAMACNNISPSFLIGHVGYWGWQFQQTILGTERALLLDRSQSALDAGMRISFHSDNAVTPLGPLRLMEQAITRIMESAPKELGTEILNEKERISRLQALRAVTYDAAWQCHADKWTGSLEVGKCADFVILEQDPLTYSNKDKGIFSAEGMRDIPVLETWKGGIRTFPEKCNIPVRNTKSDQTN
ncbi:MAG: amidohydrolase, partial [Endozoicomonas sp.]